MLPHYLALGVDYKTFMECNPYELRAFDRAFNKKHMTIDTLMWEMGVYVRIAVASTFNKDNKYPEKPLFSQEESISSDPQANERLAALEMDQYIKVLMQQGNLPETTIADIKES